MGGAKRVQLCDARLQGRVCALMHFVISAF